MAKSKAANDDKVMRDHSDATEVAQIDSQAKRDKKKRKRDADAGEDGAKKSKKRKESSPVVDENEQTVQEVEKKTKKKSKSKKASDEGDELKALGEGKLHKKSKKEKKAKETDIDTQEPAESTAGSSTKGDAGEDFIPLDAGPTELDGTKEDTSLPVQAESTKSVSKKDKKKQRKKEAKEAKVDADEKNGVEGDGTEAQVDGEGEHSEKNSRFVVFVGNLPFTATKEQIQEHFASLKPSNVRLMTDRHTKKPKGFAFIEFSKFDKMQTCLKKFNHSIFPDGKKGRKINIELTAGGGGNNSSRREKIQHKNDRLNNQRENERVKREEIKAKQEERQEKKDARQKEKKPKAGEEAPKAEQEQGPTEPGMHPARLAMLQGGAPRRREAVRF